MSKQPTDDRPQPPEPCYAELVERVEKVKALCQRYNSSAVNTVAHALAAKVLRILDGTG